MKVKYSKYVCVKDAGNIVRGYRPLVDDNKLFCFFDDGRVRTRELTDQEYLACEPLITDTERLIDIEEKIDLLLRWHY